MNTVFIKTVILIVLQLGLSNCAYIYSKSNNVAEKVNYLADQQKFGLALETLDYITPEHYNYAFLMSEKNRIQKLAKKYEKKSLEKADKLAREKHWAAAMQTYDKALANLPNSKKIKLSRKKFIDKRDNYLKQLKNKLLVSNAKTLSKKTATTKEIAQVNPNDRKAKNILSSHIREIKLTSEKLITCAEDSIKINDIQLAEECLLLASNLSTSATANKKIKALKDKIRKEKKSRRKKNKKSIINISKSLAQVKTNKELIRYKNEIFALYRHDKSNKKLIKLKKQLEKRIDRTLKTGIEQGRNLYSQGQIKQALEQWNELHQLKPSNSTLNGYIHRAERVLRKLQSLSKNPAAIPPPKSGG